MKEIEGDPAYPIFSYSARWSQYNDEDKEYSENWTKGLLEGRIWNSSGNSKIFKVDPSDKELDKILEILEHEIKANSKYKNVEDYISKIEFKCYETWHLSWFCHETFKDSFLQQAEGFEFIYKNVMNSFEKYVQRNEILMRQSERESSNGLGSITLMGAEDRWRWRGELDGDPPPCRCKGCERSELIRINH